MDWSFIQKFTPMYVEAAWLTLVIGVLGIVLSIAIGLICAWVKYYKVPVARQIVAVYIELSRNTPLIVQLFFLYFGLPTSVKRSMRCYRSGFPGRKLHGRKLPKRSQVS